MNLQTNGSSCRCGRCNCTDAADLVLGGTPLCGCCAADCPDKHGVEAEERRICFWREHGSAWTHPRHQWDHGDCDDSEP